MLDVLTSASFQEVQFRLYRLLCCSYVSFPRYCPTSKQGNEYGILPIAAGISGIINGLGASYNSFLRDRGPEVEQGLEGFDWGKRSPE